MKVSEYENDMVLVIIYKKKTQTEYEATINAIKAIRETG